MVFRRKKKVAAKVSRKKMTGSGKPTKAMKGPIDETMLNQMIKDRAYFIWEEKGKPSGCDFDIWTEAEKDIQKKVASSK